MKHLRAELFASAVVAKITLLTPAANTVRDDCPACGGKKTLTFHTGSDKRHLRGRCATAGCSAEFEE